MGKIFKPVTADIDDYQQSLVSEGAIARQLREKTNNTLEYHQMMSTPQQAEFLALQIQLLQAKRIIEVGVFSGYGTLAMAQALPPEGKIIACDTSEDWTKIGIPFWQQAGVSDKIELHIAPAIETLAHLHDEQAHESFDFAFIDADKINYAKYYDSILPLIRPGGLIVFDNVLWIGEAVVHEQKLPATRAVCQLSMQLKDDLRVMTSLVPMGQGMLLVYKK